MNITSKIIVLHTLRYADDKLIAECLSRTSGRVTFVVRISHSTRATVRHTLFQPLAVLEAEWTVKPRGGMVTPKAVRTTLPYSTIHRDPKKTTVALFLSEMLLHVVRSDAGAAALFDYIENSLEWLDTAEEGFANFHIVFLMRLSLFLGIAPNLERRTCPFFDLMAGEFSTTPPPHAYYIEQREAAAFGQLMRMNFGTMRLFALTGEQRSRILELVLLYYRLHLPAMPDLKSLDVLKAVFE
ncbi:DNA repair protein RecO [Alloprevotella sp. OH1205_COT-284]|uniref:DNA repair protein RecO n=1 Tax=Alloprevotella sp. OH1205_COT-284 TaxID=2491043 RepID=UPI000F5EC828|nr:DNA repair protein RecO C-terminal domain-containing protein [Alloprevotella sp. OH1205_COT-284]RRD80036.1 DNA repair protein RecO [Alloprevotella sp. OH1205_COT-284]